LNIIVKFILKNIREKKLRTLLITVSVAVSCALFFASNNISDSYKASYVTMMRASVGNSDIVLYPEQKSPSKFLKLDKAERVKDRADYIIGTMNGSGSLRIDKNNVINISFRGIEYDDLMLMNPVVLTEKGSLTPFNGNKIIISEKTAKKYDLQTGKKLNILIGEQRHDFTIAAIASSSSYFKTEQENVIGIVPRETLAKLSSAEGKASSIYIKAKSSEDIKKLIEDLKVDYKGYGVSESIDEKELDSELGMVKTAFSMMLVVVLIMSMFIIYTAFKVITMERMPVIGTFRSIGATKAMTNLVLILESIIYGIIGGLFGSFLGIGILYVVGVLMNPDRKYIKIPFEYNPRLLPMAFAFGLIVSFISSALPILRVSKIPVKDIVLNNLDKVKKSRRIKPILGIIMIIYSSIVPMLISSKSPAAMPLQLTSILCIFGGTVLLLPFVNNAFSRVFEILYSFMFGNEGLLAAKNLRNNKSLLNNVTLLSIGISALFMINSVSFSMSKQVAKGYSAWNCDVVVFPRVDMTVRNEDDVRKIQKTEGVIDTAPISSLFNVEVDIKNVSNNRIMDIDSIDSRKFSSFINVPFIGSVKRLPEDFDTDRNIIITPSLKSRFNVGVGEVLNLKTDNGTKTYRVVGIFDTIMQNGSYAFIPEKYMRSDFKVRNYNRIFVKTSKDSDEVKSKLLEAFKGKRYTIETLRKMQEDNDRANKDMMRQLTAFPFISILIGAFGVVNNFIISFIERRRAFAILASIGMSRKQNIKVVFIEALSVGITGGIMGILSGFGTTLIVPSIMRAMELPLPMHYSLTLFLMCFMLGVAIALIASAGPVLKSSKLNIIEAIKYE
jgi:putative ABC transport system permease protein